jgi:long-subunit fatty acid transport protein
MGRRILWLLFLGFLLHGSAVGQGLPTTLEFSFSNPGARSMGLGGAFVALADDATAAFANPAGLVQLTRPEISIEGRFWSYTNPFTEGGRLTGQPTGILLDDTSGLRFGSSSADLSSLSFLSFVYPKGPWAVALFRHQLANFEQFTETQGVFADEPGFANQPPRLADLRASTDLGIVNYGAAAAYRLSDAISLGLGISYVEADFELESSLYLVEDPTLEESQFGPNPYLPDRRVVSAIVDSQSWDWSLTLGILGQLSSRWSYAAFYRQGPDFDVRVDTVTGPGPMPTIPDGTLLETESAVLPLPDVFGLGVAFKPLDALTVAFEWDRVQYSQIFAEEDTSRLDDGDELRLGVEYVFIRATPIIAVRSGIWLDPDHRIRAVSDDVFEQALLRGGDDEWHYAVGLGFVFERFQIDLGADLSELVDRLALSAIFNF